VVSQDTLRQSVETPNVVLSRMFGCTIAASCCWCVCGKGKGKGTVQLIIGHETPEVEWRYSYTLSFTSTLDGVGGQHHTPAALPPEKTRYPLYRRMSGPQVRSRQVRKISSPPAFDPRTVQPVQHRKFARSSNVPGFSVTRSEDGRIWTNNV
jgi:hypothetical protein